MKKEFLRDFINKLPENCLFDKGKIGCGGTSLAIECEDPFVIAVPFISLVENKVSQYPNKRSHRETGIRENRIVEILPKRD